MKQKIYIYGLIAALIIVAGTVFKVNHLPGAGILLTVGIAALVLFFIPSALISNYKSGDNRQSRSLYIITWITCFIIFSAMLFKVQHWPFAGALLTIAIPFPYVVFLPVFLFVTSKNKNFNIYNTVFVLLLLALNSVFSGLLALNVAKTRIDESYNLSRNYISMETVLKQIPHKNEGSSVAVKIDEVLKIVNDYRGKILKDEDLSSELWNKEPGGLWRPNARGIAAVSILNTNGSYAGEELQKGIKDLISELEKNSGYESLAKAAPAIFNYSDGGDEPDSWARQIFSDNTLSWSLMYLDGLEANLNMIKASI
jgi:hypothetical protein